MEGQKQIRKKPRLWLALLKYFKWIVMTYGILFLAEVGLLLTYVSTLVLMGLGPNSECISVKSSVKSRVTIFVLLW